jgi:hypothetical protein
MKITQNKTIACILIGVSAIFFMLPKGNLTGSGFTFVYSIRVRNYYRYQ